MTAVALVIPPHHPDHAAATRALSVAAHQGDVRPGPIVRATTADHVIEAVRRAVADGTRVAVRSGGSCLSATHLRPGAVSLDLRGLHQVRRDEDVLDPSGTGTLVPSAWCGTGLTVLQASAALDDLDASFPLGHFPTVGLGGYLLSGGNGWGTREWGHGAERVVAAQVVLADGALVTVDDTTHPDLLRVLRGAGPGFPGVVVSFRLALVAGRRNLSRLTVTVGGEHATELGQILDGAHAALAPEVEVTTFVRRASASPSAPAPTSSGMLITVFATCFAPSEQDSEQLLAPLQALARLANVTTTASGRSLHDLVAALPRHELDTMASHHTWSDAGYASLLPALVAATASAPSPRCSILLSATSRRADGSVPPRAVYAPLGRTSIAAYAHWTAARSGEPAQVAQAAWTHRRWAHRAMDAVPEQRGRFIGEVDLTGPSQWARDCFTDESWAQILATREAYDPDHRFWSYLDAPQSPGGSSNHPWSSDRTGPLTPPRGRSQHIGEQP